jgi:hypothetical protein
VLLIFSNTSAFVALTLLQWRLLTDILLPSQSSNSWQDVSNVTESSEECRENQPITIRLIKDNNGLILRHLLHYPVTVGKNGKRSTLTQECKLCKEKGVKNILWASIALHALNRLHFAAQISMMMGEIASKSTLKT